MDDKFLSASISVLGYIPFLDNAIWGITNHFSKTKTISLYDYQSYIGGVVGTLGKIKNLGKFAKAASKFSDILTVSSFAKVLYDDSSYTNEITHILFSSYYSSSTLKKTVKKFVLYSTAVKDMTDLGIITYDKSWCGIKDLNINRVRLNQYFAELGVTAKNLGKKIK